MENAIVIGPCGFVGYGLCRYLLDLGLQVWGMESSLTSSRTFQVEKQMEIGRNANYMDNPEKDWFENKGKGPVLFIPYYDYFMDMEEQHLFPECSVFREMAEEFLGDVSSAVLIAPRQFADGLGDEAKEFLQLRNYLEEKVEGKIATAYLPTVFGPWQPDHYLFQQLLFPCSKKNLALQEREPAGEAVYVDDVARLLVELAGHAGDFWVGNKNGGSWEEGLSLLADWSDTKISIDGLSLGNSQARINRPAGFTDIRVKQPFNMEEGLMLQKQKYEQWLSQWQIKR